jgi:GNAT superfamily N-acetyltransferase
MRQSKSMLERSQLQTLSDTPLVVNRHIDLHVDFDIHKVAIRRGTSLQGGDWTFRAFYRSRRIGYLMVSRFQLDGHPPDERAPWKAVVAEEFRRKGVATKLYDTAERWLLGQNLKLVPGLGLETYCVSDDAYKFWLKRAPDHPAVRNDARRFEEQFSGRPYMHNGESWTIDHTAGHQHFLIRNAARNCTSTVRASLVWDIYGKPGEPSENSNLGHES